MGLGRARSLCSYLSVRITDIPISIHTLQNLHGKVVGIMVLYPGKDAPKLDQNLSDWLAEKGAGNSEIDAESFADELIYRYSLY